MKKLFALIAVCALAMALAACSPASKPATLSVDSNGDSISIEATGGITAEDTTNLSVPENGGVGVVASLTQGEVTIVYLDGDGNELGEDVYGDYEAKSAMDLNGELTVKVSAENAEGTIEVMALDADKLAQALEDPEVLAEE